MKEIKETNLSFECLVVSIKKLRKLELIVIVAAVVAAADPPPGSLQLGFEAKMFKL